MPRTQQSSKKTVETSFRQQAERVATEKARREATVERGPIFVYDREAERRIDRAFEAALPNFRKLSAELD